MPNGELQDLSSAPLPNPTASSFRLPAEYYSAPRSAEVRPLLPKWVPWGCGGLAAVFLVVLFAGGAAVSSGAFPRAIAFLVEWTANELPPLYTDAVAQPQRQALDAELDRFVANIGAGRIALPKVQPVLRSIRDAVKDGKVDPSEVDELTVEARAANAAAKT